MFHLCKAVLPGMLNRGHGIINMSSVASSVKGVENRFVYGTTKAAVIGLTKAIAADYVAKDSLQRNLPRYGQNPVTCSGASRLSAGTRKRAWKRFADRQPMGRLGEADEIAALALYLASDESSFTTGAIHIIDGGWST